jgi:hypothetical protein
VNDANYLLKNLQPTWLITYYLCSANRRNITAVWWLRSLNTAFPCWSRLFYTVEAGMFLLICVDFIETKTLYIYCIYIYYFLSVVRLPLEYIILCQSQYEMQFTFLGSNATSIFGFFHYIDAMKLMKFRSFFKAAHCLSD